ncbi:uncharacterized protein LOC113211670 isoform X3 [Frankliniella occidentalis]|uniref:Uncharacterized protein LOC113211670 isoform X3 n=1 Tax=Frankliniella occidentalis TaxID=133901 RepID=A0A9C6WWD5_FRAOC|nr:uncharacterized protein LOC113211670 isoform X3 [Frankliniella occidentalis]
MVPGPRRAAAVAVLVLAAAGHLAGEDVAALAADLFAARGVRAVLVALRAGGPATFGVYRALSSDGRFQVSQTVGSTTVAHVLDTSERPYVGVVLEAGEPPPWFDPGDRAWFNGSYVWLVVDGDAAARTASWALRLDSEVFLAAQDDGDRAWRVDEVFRVNAEDAAVRRPFASWSPAGGLVAADPELAVAPVSSPGGDPLADRRTQFRRVLAGPRQLRVESSVYCEAKTGKDLMERVLDLPTDEVMKHFNHLSIATFTIMANTFDRFNMSVRHHEHLISGELAAPPSGHFSGACGNVQRGVDDVVVTGLLMSDGRLQVFKYSATTYHFRFRLLRQLGVLPGPPDRLRGALHAARRLLQLHHRQVAAAAAAALGAQRPRPARLQLPRRAQRLVADGPQLPERVAGPAARPLREEDPAAGGARLLPAVGAVQGAAPAPARHHRLGGVRLQEHRAADREPGLPPARAGRQPAAAHRAARRPPLRLHRAALRRTPSQSEDTRGSEFGKKPRLSRGRRRGDYGLLGEICFLI